jgi:hypothetical protein
MQPSGTVAALLAVPGHCTATATVPLHFILEAVYSSVPPPRRLYPIQTGAILSAMFCRFLYSRLDAPAAIGRRAPYTSQFLYRA